jgi:transposase InsO family protein
VNKYTFIDTQKANFPVRALCRVLSVPESSYFDWHACGRARQTDRDVAKSELVTAIRTVHDDSDATYGSPRVHDGLRKQGVVVSLRRVAETMADARIVGLSGREHSTTTTRRDRMAAPFPDLVARNFLPLFPDTLWYGDVTYIWITDRFWYLATVLDAATKELVGWSFADHMRTELVTDALHAAVRRRGGQVPAGLIFHSDRGSQYTSDEYGVVCGLYKIRQSMGRRGVCYDNAGAESFFATIKRELVDRYTWNDPTILRIHLFNWIETWYNRRRTHTSIGMRTPHQAYNDHLNRSAA